MNLPRLEVDGPVAGLLDDPLLLRARGAGPEAELVWRARFRDDDGRIWRATAGRGEDLAGTWEPAKAGTGPVAALRSLRPVAIDVRVETADGRTAARTFTRRLIADGVRPRRWRDGLAATLYLPAGDPPCATLLADATGGPEQAAAAALAGPLLASRGVLVLAVGPGPGRTPAGDVLAAARDRLAAVPMAGDDVRVLPVADPLAGDPPAGDAVVLPPGVGVREDADRTAARTAAWERLLAGLGARPRATG